MDVEARVRIPRGPHTDARLRRDARGGDGGARQELAKVRFRGQIGKHVLILSLTAFDPSGHSLDLPIGLSHRPRDGSVVSFDLHPLLQQFLDEGVAPLVDEAIKDAARSAARQALR